jgi:chromosome segregation ATPase
MSLYTFIMVSRFDELKTLEEDATVVEKATQEELQITAETQKTTNIAEHDIGAVRVLNEQLQDTQRGELELLRRENSALQQRLIAAKNTEQKTQEEIDRLTQTVNAFGEKIAQLGEKLSQLSSVSALVADGAHEQHAAAMELHSDIDRLDILTKRLKKSEPPMNDVHTTMDNLRKALTGRETS